MSNYFSFNNTNTNATTNANNDGSFNAINVNNTNANPSDPAGNNVNNWNNDAFDNDDFDSDQLDEDDSYSWVSGTDNQDVNFGVNVNCSTGRGSINIHWRDWHANTANNSDPYRPSQLVVYQGLLNKQLNQDKSSTGARQLESLVDLCSKYVATNVPFELVECFEQPVPEDLQLKIIRASFPDRIENIRLYSCLANGNADQYERGELLYHNKCVKKVMQIGFHLSAQVVISSQLEANGTRAASSNHGSHQGSSSNSNQESQLSCLLSMGGCRQSTFIGNGSGASSLFASVSIVCDRKRVTSCHCSCSKQAIPWCSHIVAVCLYRIFNIESVEFRPPVSESFSKLKRDQLQKFAQYLISELPQQILPTAQKLLDELLKGNNSSINMMRGAPDPTAGASQTDIAVWCLDELVLKENIHKTLLKFIVLTPNVVSDVESLESSSSVTAADEYKNLLQPLKDRQPDGIWNLVSIVREMLTRRDKNSIPMLKLITCECIEIDQILQYWFLVKAFQHNSDKSIMNTVTVFSQKSNSSSHANMAQTSPVHQRCASLMDEIVTLWGIACLNPYIEVENSKIFLEMLQKWHHQTIERLRRFCNSIINSSTNNWANMNQQSQSATNLNNGQKLLKRLEMDMFAGFMPAINACSITWSGFDLSSNASFRLDCLRQIGLINQLSEPIEKQSIVKIHASSGSSSSNSSSQSLSSASSSSSSAQQLVNESAKTDENSTAGTSEDSKVMDGIAKLYQYEPAKLKELESQQQQLRIKAGHDTKVKPDKSFQPQEDTALDILFHRCEALFFHGYVQQACILAECLAEQLLTTRTKFQSLFNTRDSKMTQTNPDETQPTNNIPHGSKLGRQKCLTSFHNTVLWRAFFLCNILNDCATKMVSVSAQNTFDDFMKLRANQVKWLAFRIGVFGLETPRMPAISKTLEVKLLYQEECLAKLLEHIVIGNEELGLLKDRATQLKDNGQDYNRQQRLVNPTGYQSLPILLALFIFESFTNFSMNNNGEFEMEMAQSNFNIGFYQNLGFEAACTVLGMKANASESAHSILCEGIRRQKGVLALKLLEKFKDEEQSLLKIMGRLLDTDVYSLFKQDSVVMLNPFNPNFKKIQQRQLNLFLNENDPSKSPSDDQDPKTSIKSEPSLPKAPVGVENIKKMPVVNKVSQLPTSTVSNTPLDIKSDQETATKVNGILVKPSNLTYIDSLSSGWEESENESPNMSKDISLLETKYRCLNMSYPPAEPSKTVPALSERAKETDNVPSSDNNSPVMSRKPICEVKTPTGESNQNKTKRMVISASKVDSGDESDDSSSSGTQSIPVTLKEAAPVEASVMTRDGIVEEKMDSLKRLNDTLEKKHQNAKGSFRAQNQPRQLNQPSLALAHFMFEFSKTVLSKAGGTISNSVYLNHMNHQSVVVHRNLQICSFLIGLYSLGLNNCVQSNWFSRTYSSTVTWLNGQAAEIGYAAICVLIECWEGRLTPSECAILADRVSRGRDNMTVKAAAELALSGLKYANYMKPTEIQRAVLQCKEQSNEMLERACIVVEKSVKNDNLFEVLFAIAKKWEELFMEELNQFNMVNNALNPAVNPTTAVATQDPPPILEMMNGQNQIINANLEAYIREQQQQQGSGNNNANNFFNPGPNMGANFNQRMSFNSNQMFPLQQQGHNMNQMNQNNPNLPFLNNPAMFQHQVNNNFAQQQQHQFHPQQQNSKNNPNFPFNLSMQQLNFYQQNNIRVQQQQNLNQIMNNQALSAYSPTKPITPKAESNTSPIADNLPPIKHLKTAFRVAMLGLEALPKRADGTNQSVKYRQNPIYFEDVKWLWETAIKLDAYLKSSASLQQFCQTAACVIQNPFVLQKLAFDTASYMSGNNLTQFKAILGSPLLNILVQRCMNLYLRCCQLKLHHMSQNEHDDFISMILTARNIFFYSNNMNCFSDLIQNITRSHRCKRDLQNKIYNALNTPNFQLN